MLVLYRMDPVASTSALAPEPIAVDAIAPAVPLTKSAAKRLARRAAFEAAKPARRLAERNKKKAKSAEKRKLVELGVIEDAPRMNKRNKAKEQATRVNFGSTVVVDLGFDELMNDKEIKSMTAQLGYCYSANRLAQQPVNLVFTSFSGNAKSRMEGIGRTHENWKKVEWWEEKFEELYSLAADEVENPSITYEVTTSESMDATKVADPHSCVPPVLIGTRKGLSRTRTPKEKIIYLTGDSPNVLSTIDPTVTYIVGGIVDKNRHKLLCYNKAESLGLAHAQLPIGQFLPLMESRRILAVNHVVEILLKFIEVQDWEKAFLEVIPMRKLNENKGDPAGVDRAAEEGDKLEIDLDDEEEPAVYVARESDDDDTTMLE